MIERLQVTPGAGTVIRFGDLAAWVAPGASLGLVTFLAESARNLSNAPTGGELVASHLAGVLRRRDPEPGVAFAVIGPSPEGWTALLHGPVQVWDGARWLWAEDVVGWMSAVVAPSPALSVGERGSVVPEVGADQSWGLDAGVVPGGGFVMVAAEKSRFAEDEASAWAAVAAASDAPAPAGEPAAPAPQGDSTKTDATQTDATQADATQADAASAGGPPAPAAATDAAATGAAQTDVTPAGEPPTPAGETPTPTGETTTPAGEPPTPAAEPPVTADDNDAIASAGPTASPAAGQTVPITADSATPSPTEAEPAPVAEIPEAAVTMEIAAVRVQTGAEPESPSRPEPPDTKTVGDDPPGARAAEPAPETEDGPGSRPPGVVDLRSGPALARVIPYPPLPPPGDLPPPVPGAPVVAGVTCRRGHLNRPGALVCARCGGIIGVEGAYQVTGMRPALGCLVTDRARIFSLDSGYVVGSEPERDPTVRGHLARPLQLEGEDVAATHAEIRLHDWDVVVTDRASEGGTHIFVPGATDWERLTPFDPRILEPGTHIAFGQRVVTFLTPRTRPGHGPQPMPSDPS